MSFLVMAGGSPVACRKFDSAPQEIHQHCGESLYTIHCRVAQQRVWNGVGCGSFLQPHVFCSTVFLAALLLPMHSLRAKTPQFCWIESTNARRTVLLQGGLADATRAAEKLCQERSVFFCSASRVVVVIVVIVVVVVVVHVLSGF